MTLSIGFDWVRNRKQGVLTNNKNQTWEYHLRLMLRDIFGGGLPQEKTTYGFGYKLTLTENTDNSVLNAYDAINNAKNKHKDIEWYIPHYTPSMEQHKINFEHFLS